MLLLGHTDYLLRDYFGLNFHCRGRHRRRYPLLTLRATPHAAMTLTAELGVLTAISDFSKRLIRLPLTLAATRPRRLRKSMLARR